MWSLPRTAILIIALHAALVFIILGLAIRSGHAQPVCGSWAEIVVLLKERFGEVEVGSGLATSTSSVRLFASPDGSFSIVVVNPNGLTCLVLSGEDWETMPLPVAGKES